METLEYIHSALSSSGGPISRNRLLAILTSWGHTTTRRSLNVALEFFFAMGALNENSEGLIWIAPTGGGSKGDTARRASVAISAR